LTFEPVRAFIPFLSPKPALRTRVSPNRDHSLSFCQLPKSTADIFPPPRYSFLPSPLPFFLPYGIVPSKLAVVILRRPASVLHLFLVRVLYLQGPALVGLVAAPPPEEMLQFDGHDPPSHPRRFPVMFAGLRDGRLNFVPPNLGFSPPLIVFCACRACLNPGGPPPPTSSFSLFRPPPLS